MELHGYALPSSYADITSCDEGRIKAELLRSLNEIYPETIGARIIDERFLLRRDCPGFEPGSWSRRPTVATAHRGLKLAGDLVRLPFPTALMERAVSSGFLAANALLDEWNVAPEPIWSVPPRGMLAGLQSWQRGRRAK